VLDLEPAPEVPDAPSSLLVLVDRHVARRGQNLFVERIRDDLPERVTDLPVLEHLLDVEIEQPLVHARW
jgi:hypothetical protein